MIQCQVKKGTFKNGEKLKTDFLYLSEYRFYDSVPRIFKKNNPPGPSTHGGLFFHKKIDWT